jgi:hypothetical protein
MLQSRHQNAGQNRDIKIVTGPLKMWHQLKYLGMTVINQNLIQMEIERRPNSGIACCHLVQNLLSSPLLSENVKIRIYKIIILHVVVYGCKTWSKDRIKQTHVHKQEQRQFG